MVMKVLCIYQIPSIAVAFYKEDTYQLFIEVESPDRLVR